MKYILEYLYEYIKVGDNTTYFICFLACLALIKYLPVKISISKKTIFYILILLGLILRLLWLFESSHMPRTYWEPTEMQETDLVNLHALEMQKGVWFRNYDGSPSARRPIGYPLILGAAYALFGSHLLVAWSLNLLLQFITMLLIYKMGEALFGARLGLFALALFAFHPQAICSIKMLTDEHAFLAIWYFGLWLLIGILKRKDFAYSWLVLGVVFGFAAMIRTHAIFMPVIVSLAYFMKDKNVFKAILRGLLVFFVMQMINLPWVIRNVKVFDVPVLYTATGYYLYSQMNDYAVPKMEGHVPLKGEKGYSEELEKLYNHGNEGQAHRLANKLMKKWMLENPGKVFTIGVGRVLYFLNFNKEAGLWSLWYQFYDGQYDPNRPLSLQLKETIEEYAFAQYYAVLFSFLIGLFLFIKNRKKDFSLYNPGIYLLLACLFFYLLEHMIIFPVRKYRYPIEPLMGYFACYFWVILAFNFRFESVKQIFENIKGQKNNA